MVTPEEYEALEIDRNYFRYHSRSNEARSKANFKMLNKIHRLLDHDDVESALDLLREYLDE